MSADVMFRSLVTGLANGAWTAIAGYVLLWRFTDPDGRVESFYMDGGPPLPSFGPGNPPRVPHATIDVDLGAAMRLLSDDVAVDDVKFAVDAGLVRVTGDAVVTRHLARAALAAGGWG